MWELVRQWISPNQYIPHGHCYLWQPSLVWLHLLSDLLIAIAYFSISLMLVYFMHQRQDVPFRGIFGLFGAFIVACGLTHLMAVWTLWHPAYWLSGTLKAITALVSGYTALTLVPIIPQALSLPSPTQLALTNKALLREVKQRQAAEAELATLNRNLEQRVEERTLALQTAIADTQTYAERLTLALDAANMGLWDWDVRTNRVYWSPQHEALFGYPTGQSERTYEDWARRVHPEDLPDTEAKLTEALNTCTDYVNEYRIQWPDGSQHWIRGTGRCYPEVDGKPQRALGIMLNITERKQSEQALRDSEAQFRATFEQAAVGVGHVDLDGHWLRVNQTLCGIVGYSQTELLSKTFQEITHPDDLDADLKLVQQLMAGECSDYSLEKRYIRKDGSPVWIELTVSLLRSSEGQPLYFIAVIEEIGDRIQAQQSLKDRATELSWVNKLLSQTTQLLRKRNQELDQFAYIASHDLKAPLRAIANLSEWIEEDITHQLSAENQHYFTLLRNRVNRMENLINGLLDYSRVNRQVTEPETVDVATLLTDIIDFLAPPPDFTIEIEHPMPTLVAKTIPLRQVFSNLISNAISHHDRSDGNIKISATDEDQFYEFAVADDGPGIHPDYFDKIFIIFQTLQSRDIKESTGIGLAIVKKAVESEGGTIRVESTLGQGATFTFTWPKHPLEQPDQIQPERAGDTHSD